MVPVSAPITGTEQLGDLRQPVQALAQFYQTFNSRDLVLMAENWSASDDVVMDNPVGGVMRGWDEISSSETRRYGESRR